MKNTHADIDRAILADARAGEGQMVIMAIAILRRPGAPDVLVHSVQEHGDDEGIGQMWDFIASCKANRVLEVGESLHLELRLIPWQAMRLLQNLEEVSRCQG